MHCKIRAICKLSHAQISWKGLAFSQPCKAGSELIQSYFKNNRAIDQDNENIVTDIGFVNMAIYTDRVVKINETLIVPGSDSEGINTTKGRVSGFKLRKPLRSTTGCSKNALVHFKYKGRFQAYWLVPIGR